jgi:hypothetical protein
MKAAKLSVQEAEERARSLLWQIWWRGCDGDAMANAALLISSKQTLGKEQLAKIGQLLVQYMRDGDRIRRLMNVVDGLKVLTTRERVLIAYGNVTHRHERLPYESELMTEIKSIAGRNPVTVPSGRHIRQILKQLSLPLPRGRPPKKRK